MRAQLRKIYLFNNELNFLFPNNAIKTTKYNLITFLPLALLYQFKNYSNIYFLVVAIILAIKEISPQDPTVAIIPFICVIIIGLLVEGYEELKKWRNDKKFNNSLSNKVNPDTKEETEIKWSDLKVGDIIQIKKNETIPADALILKTSLANNFCYMQTTNLDGESALKPRETIPLFHGLFSSHPIDLSVLRGCVIELENPSYNIYQCNGSVTMSNNCKAFFQIENTLLRGTTLKNVDYVYAIILYTGKDTKIMMNIQSSSLKSSSIETIINYILIGVIFFVFILCIICTVLGMVFLNKHVPDYKSNQLSYDYIYYSPDGDYPYVLEFFKLFGAYFILFNNIIPISLTITFTIAKVIQILIIEFDPKMQLEPSDKIKVLSNRLQEDLGKVRFIFSDKTGTLTRNEMKFKGCSVYGQLYYDDIAIRDKGLIITPTDILNINDDKNNNNNTNNDNTILSLESRLINALSNELPIQTLFGNKNEERFKSTQDALIELYSNIALNHNVLSECDESTQQFFYQGPNPDEVALVSMAKNIGIEFIERIGNSITLKILGKVKEYEVLQVFAYSSERKRSGIIVKETSTEDIKLYVKGADDKLFIMIDDFSRRYLLDRSKEHLDLFAKNGLRTLCYASKTLSLEQYEEWALEYNKLKTASLIDKLKLPEVEKKIIEIEENLLFLGVSGLEDRLQDQAKEDIGKFIEAGIQVWMITGDQLDTAESIGYSSNLFEDDTEVYKIRSISTKQEILEYMQKTAKEISTKEEEIAQYKLQYKPKKTALPNNSNNNNLIGNIKGINTGNFYNSEGNEKEINNHQFIRQNSQRKYNDIYNSIDDLSIIKYMVNQHIFGDSHGTKQEADTFIKCVNYKGNIKSDNNYINNNNNLDNQEDNTLISPNDLYNQYKNKLNEINENKKRMDKLMMITNLKIDCASKKGKALQNNVSLFNYGFVIEGNALVHCLSDEIKELFYELIIKSRSVICCRCTPIQKSNIVEFIKRKSHQICLAIGDGGNDVNMIKKANIGIGIYGKEGHQAAYNSDYAIAQFKYLKRLLFYHGRYILLRNTYFIYFFFYKGILFCFPNFIFGLYTGFSGANFYDFVWFTFYTGLISTAPPVVYMVFEEDINVSFYNNPELTTLLPDIYKEFRDSGSFNVGKYFIIFALGMVHSALLFLWSIYAFDKSIIDSEGRVYSFWSPSNMVMLVVLIVQSIILFIDTHKWSLWVLLCHLLQIVVNIMFGAFYGLGNTDELSAYTYDTLANVKFWLILICGTIICLIPIYLSRFCEYLFADTIINNIRNKKSNKEFEKKACIKKIHYINKYTRNLTKFKRIYKEIDKYKADNFADRKMKEIVQMYVKNKIMITPKDENIVIPITKGNNTLSTRALFKNDLKENNNNNFICNKVEIDNDIISEIN